VSFPEQSGGVRALLEETKVAYFQLCMFGGLLVTDGSFSSPTPPLGPRRRR
jgi:hypothetical protein